jgi:hypothetical protein
MRATMALVLTLVGLVGMARAHEPDATCVPPSSRTVGGVLDLRVGYVEAPPLAWNAWGRPAHPAGLAVDVLTHLAHKNGWRLHFAPMAAGNVVASVAHCKIDIGIVPATPGGAVTRDGNPPDLTAPYLETVAAVALLGDPSGGAPAVAAGAGPAPAESGPSSGVRVWIAGGVRALLCGLLGVALLALLVWVANQRVPWARGRWWPERWQVVALDATVPGPRAGLPWLWSSRAGQILLGTWFLGAVGVALWQMPVHAAPWAAKRAEYVEALQRSLDGMDAIGVRPGGRTVACHDVVRCLQDLSRGDLSAVAAGAEVICHHVRTERLEHVQFASSLVWPMAHAYLVPPGASLRRTLNAALAQAQREDAAALAELRAAYGLPWSAPTLSPSCPVVAEVKR